jgi:hypothetical protein
MRFAAYNVVRWRPRRGGDGPSTGRHLHRGLWGVRRAAGCTALQQHPDVDVLVPLGHAEGEVLERVRADVYAPSERAVAQRAVGAPPECGVVRPIEGHRRNRETPVPWVFSGTSDARCHRRRRRSWQRPARSSARGSTQARWSASADGANTRLPAPATERWFDQPSEPKPKPLTNWSQGLGRGGTNLTRGG